MSRLLRNPEEAGLALLMQRHRRVLQLVHEPTFTPHQSWTVFRDAEQPYLVVRLRWDHEKVVNHVSYLERDALDELLSRRIDIPVLGCEPQVGLDGELWEFSMGDVFQRVQLAWWCDGPDDWRPFVDWVRELRALVE